MIAWFVRNGVSANLLMIMIIIAGAFQMKNTELDLFPSFELDLINVSVPYPGATPAETEEAICKRIEEEIFDLDGIKEMSSRAVEGMGVVTVEIMKGYDGQILLDEIKSRVDAIVTFPEEAEKPNVEMPEVPSDVITLTIYGEVDERTIKEFGEQMREEITNIPGITRVDLYGVRDYEVSVELDEQKLREYGLSFAEVSRAIQTSSLDLPAGVIRAEGGEILVRSSSQAYTREDFEQLILRTGMDGSRILLSDVARVVDGFKDEPMDLRFDGRRAIALRVLEVGDQSTIAIADKVKAFVAENEHRLPEGLSWTLWRDWSFYLKGRLNMLIENGLIGLALVFCLLTLFLRPSLAIWVSIGIPIAFLGAFTLMPLVDVSINIISLFGFIMVLGIIVDDAIVVGESVFSTSQRIGPGKQASIEGSHEVAIPVTFAVLTTMVAFTPILFMEGMMGKFLAPIPYVVISALLFSLIESKLILPYHLSLCKVGQQDRKKLNPLLRVQRAIADGLERFVEKVYEPVLAWVLPRRYVVWTFFGGVLMIFMSLIPLGYLKVEMFPSPPSDYVVVRMTMNEGTPETQTREAVDRLMRAMDQAVAEFKQEGFANPIEHANWTIGAQPFGGGPGGGAPTSNGPQAAEIMVEMEKSEDRELQSTVFAARWRKIVGDIPGTRELVFNARAANAGIPMHVQLSSRDIDQMRAAAEVLKKELMRYEGLYDVRDDFVGGKREINICVRPEAEALGLRQRDLAAQVRAAFHGAESQRVQRGREDLRIMVRYPEEGRRSLGDLEAMRILLPDGSRVPFYEVAEVEMQLGKSMITRVDRRRVINVLADADKDSLTLNLNAIKQQLEQEIMPRIMAQHPGVSWRFQGEAKEGAQALSDLFFGALVVVAAIYCLMAIPFKSYIQPLIVISVVPFGLIGAFGGHILQGYFKLGAPMAISNLSMLGILAMGGVLVNDSLVMVDFINKRVAKGMSLNEAVRAAGARRFRPILLTSLTTFAGLVPILLETSLQAQFLIPMATSLAFGVLFGTAITLILVPSVYLMIEDLKRFFLCWWKHLKPLPPIEEKPTVTETSS